MIGHLFKLVWNRRWANLLIVAEILGSFLVVFALAVAALFFGDRYRDPLGFECRDVWHIDVNRSTAASWDMQWPPADAETFRNLLRAVDELTPVLAVAGASTAPYKGSVHTTSWQARNRDVDTELSIVTPGFAEVLGLELVAGRWLTVEDSALDFEPIVIDEDLARQLAGDEDPVGRRVSEAGRELRVVGVVRDYRRGGELDENAAYAFQSARLERDDGRALRVILVKLAPGTPAEFEERLMQTLEAVAHGWSFQIRSLETARASYLRGKLVPLAAIGLVAGFLLLMVVLGLTGVMWQNVTRRTREIGLRRATGARRADIRRQIVGEVMITATLGLVVGALIAVQVPLVGPFTFVPLGVVLQALVVSAGLILLLAGLCGLYPGFSATRIPPAEALHYE
jgi:putative ABC transport system permease protein